MRRHDVKRVVILYHNECFDGFAGAWSAWKKFGKHAEYIGLEHDEDPPKGLRGMKLYFIDFTYSNAHMVDIKASAQKLTVLDHHKSHEQATRIADEYRYSLTQSGCMLAWKFFHPKKRVPLLLKHIQDHDLYTHRLPHTREYISYISTLNFDFATYTKLARDFESSKKRKRVFELGALVRKAEEHMISKTLPNAVPILFHGKKTLAINSPILYSELANALYSRLKAPFGVSWYMENGSIRVSLRSNGKIDVSKIAMEYGGGGHRGAAGFSITIKRGFPWKFI
ncbi:hypothetical protein HYV71_00385 [Candidatus Uhrbacteria bacterium]|nr:hypothetical protein [Candidatus Uhrbacteria bacterium]